MDDTVGDEYGYEGKEILIEILRDRIQQMQSGVCDDNGNSSYDEHGDIVTYIAKKQGCALLNVVEMHGQ